MLHILEREPVDHIYLSSNMSLLDIFQLLSSVSHRYWCFLILFDHFFFTPSQFLVYCSLVFLCLTPHLDPVRSFSIVLCWFCVCLVELVINLSIFWSSPPLFFSSFICVNWKKLDGRDLPRSLQSENSVLDEQDICSVSSSSSSSSSISSKQNAGKSNSSHISRKQRNSGQEASQRTLRSTVRTENDCSQTGYYSLSLLLFFFFWQLILIPCRM